MRIPVFATMLSAALCSLSVVAASAETMKYKADLTGGAETPPTDSKATGTLNATYDEATHTLTWTVDYSGLTGPATAAHFHGPAPVGKPAPVEVPLAPPLDSPMKGSAALSDSQAKDLMEGKMYFNIHTADHKGGEIRGQLEKAM